MNTKENITKASQSLAIICANFRAALNGADPVALIVIGDLLWQACELQRKTGELVMALEDRT